MNGMTFSVQLIESGDFQIDKNYTLKAATYIF